MDFFHHNRTLSYALLVSVLLHGALLFIHFVPPKAFNITFPDTALEVVLVNAKTEKRPIKIDAVAQANLDGGGQVEKEKKVQPKSPLPGANRALKSEELVASHRRLKDLQKQQDQLAARVRQELQAEKDKKQIVETARQPDTTNNQVVSGNQQEGKEKADTQQQVVSSQAAAIERKIEEQANKPTKKYITPKTREVGYAMYYKSMQRKIENVGTLNFPQKNGRQMYGRLTVSIPLLPDGTLYEKEGGPYVERSSGNAALDKAALKIVRRSAPFGPFPPNMIPDNERYVWVIVTGFNFTRDGALQTESGSSY